MSDGPILNTELVDITVIAYQIRLPLRVDSAFLVFWVLSGPVRVARHVGLIEDWM